MPAGCDTCRDTGELLACSGPPSTSARRKLVEATKQSFALSDARYKGGVDSYFNLLDAQRSLYGAELELIATRLSDATNRVALYKALGGGWQ